MPPQRSRWKRRIGLLGAVVLVLLGSVTLLFWKPIVIAYHLRVLHGTSALFSEYMNAEEHSAMATSFRAFLRTSKGSARFYESFLDLLHSEGVLIQAPADQQDSFDGIKDRVRKVVLSVNEDGSRISSIFVNLDGSELQRDSTPSKPRVVLGFIRHLPVLLKTEYRIADSSGLVCRVDTGQAVKANSDSERLSMIPNDRILLVIDPSRC